MYTQQDFLTDRELSTFQTAVNQNTVPWDLNPTKTENSQSYAVSHTYWDSETGINPIANPQTYWHIQDNLVNRIYPSSILRARLQVTFGREATEFTRNVITAKDHSSYLSLYLFLNDTDGCIELASGESIQASANTVVVLSGKQEHRLVAASAEMPAMGVLAVDFIPSVKTPKGFFVAK